MGEEEFSFQFKKPEEKKPEPSWEDATREKLLELTDEMRAKWYKEKVGQYPIPGLSEEDVIHGILYHEEERTRLLRESQEDNVTDAIRNHRVDPPKK